MALGRLDYRAFVGGQFIAHSAKGSTWDKHKYVKVVDGKYYYPASYEGGRHINTEKSKEIIAKATGFISKKKSSDESEKKNETSVRESLRDKKKSEEEKTVTSNVSGSLTDLKSKTSETKKGKKRSGGSSSKAAKKDTTKTTKPHEVKAAVDPKDKKAVLARVNESLGRKSKSNIRAKSGSSSKKTKTDEDKQNLAEELVNDLEDAKQALSDRKDELKGVTDKEERASIQAQIKEAQADLAAIRKRINTKAKSTKGLRKLINQITGN